ncbi:MAG: tetratricopeptide repeat protein, partial [Candidatus Poribacteria bacterium]|nr:tetratricopeptide repeat protein [Candidatus Poribacteria bacterium]
MVKKVSKGVKTLSGFMKWLEQFNDGQYLFRGVSKHTYKLEASAYRRLPEKERNNPNKLLKINRELIDKARLLEHDKKDGYSLSDLELLSELQHYGAATCLIDFTRNAQVALWFACQQSSTGEASGKVFAVRADDPTLFKTVNPKLVAEENIEHFFEEDESGRYPLYQWQPKQQNNRVIAQQSVFIFGSSEIAASAECLVSKGSKSDILDSLDNSANITEASMYPDFDGFARLHAQNKPHLEPNVQGYLKLGTEAHLGGKLDDAIVYYTEVISLLPDAPTLSETYIKRGNACRSKGEVDQAINDYTEAIRHDPENAEVYRLRGNTYLKKDDFDNAIKDYSTAIELEPDEVFTYNRRGNIYRIKRDSDNAIKDYSTAIELKPDEVYAYNGRGDAYALKGEFDDAIKDYSTAIELEPDEVYAYNGRGDAYALKGEFDDAIKDYSTSIQL